MYLILIYQKDEIGNGKMTNNKLNSDLEIINAMFNISEKINRIYLVLVNNLKDKDNS